MYNLVFIKNFLLFFFKYIRMSGININFDDKKIKENDFYKNKKAL